MKTHVLIEQFDGDPAIFVQDDSTKIEGVIPRDLAAAARAAVADGAERIELCGGMSVELATEVIAAVGPSVEVRLNRYDYGSLELAAAYKEAYASGESIDAAFFYKASSTTELRRVDFIGLVAGVADLSDLKARAREARAAGARMYELYAGWGIEAAALLRSLDSEPSPVGFID
ncbi:DUF6506 family protein [Microbacterium sp. RU33B]|uniref:DUF6506 family protein n=1 Tax=Microbacterium sp. RU33B TaxID=1907390 RepID=UPI0009666D47|nr:DUF6506 family protein [Microbacterium sp. RU33B]SIT89778.1 hypothetical protein SAMN05880545_3201 [Microbacterium sp. RU33B]